jgi:hypothetical protein
LFLLFACNAQMLEGDDSVEPGITFEPIIGGVLASDYPEAAYINIDPTATNMYVCSGTLIAPRVVLTAGHCVDAHSRWEVHVAGSTQVSTSSAVYDWNEKGATSVNPAHHDIGLVFLSQPIQLSRFPTLSTSVAATNSAATCVGRVLNGTVQSGAYKANTTLAPADSIGYPYDYRSAVVIQPGDSGGPVFLSNTHQIAAVNSGASTSLQVLARVDLLRDWISAQIQSHGGSGTSVLGGSGGASAVGAGGAKATGGSVATGGAKATGGSVATGGAKATGGSVATGGAKATGGSVATGGAKATGGSVATGGAKATGGSVATGGAKATGGSIATGGAVGATCNGIGEVEPNATLATATPFSASVCGRLAIASDVDFFVTTLAVGSRVVQLTTASDATMNVGAVSGSTCIISLSGTKRIGVTVTGASAKLCIQVVSSTKTAQNYSITVQ